MAWPRTNESDVLSGVEELMYHLYVLRNIHNRLYIGHTKDLNQRLTDHRTRHGAKFIKDYGDFKLIHKEEYLSRAQAMKREKQLEGWTRVKKEALIAGDSKLLKRL